MFSTAADGYKLPLSVIGKINNPHCFRPLRVIRKDLPMDYNHQKNDWFYIDVSVYYMTFIFSYLLWTSALFLILKYDLWFDVGYGIVD